MWDKVVANTVYCVFCCYHAPLAFVNRALDGNIVMCGLSGHITLSCQFMAIVRSASIASSVEWYCGAVVLWYTGTVVSVRGTSCVVAGRYRRFLAHLLYDQLFAPHPVLCGFSNRNIQVFPTRIPKPH